SLSPSRSSAPTSATRSLASRYSVSLRAGRFSRSPTNALSADRSRLARFDVIGMGMRSETGANGGFRPGADRGRLPRGQRADRREGTQAGAAATDPVPL